MEKLNKTFAAAVMLTASGVAEATVEEVAKPQSYATGMYPSFVMDAFRWMGSVFSWDDRENLSDRLKTDLAAIGQLRIDVNSDGQPDTICTATLIEDEKIKTAAHCLYNPETKEPIPLKNMTFHSGYHNGKSIAVSPIAEAEIAEEFEYTPESLSRWNTSDSAYLKLSESFNGLVTPIPLANIEEIKTSMNYGWMSYSKELDILQAGYSFDNPEILTGSECKIEYSIFFSHKNTAFKTDCDAAPGDSGSPFLLQTPNGLKVAGILTGGITEKGKTYGEEAYGHAGFLDPAQQYKPF